MKTCIKCNEEKPLDQFNLRHDSDIDPDRRFNRCKACQAAYHKAYYLRERKVIRQNAKDYYNQNREHIRAQQAEYRRRMKVKEALKKEQRARDLADLKGLNFEDVKAIFEEMR